MEKDPEFEVRLSLFLPIPFFFLLKFIHIQCTAHIFSCFCQKYINDYLEAKAIALPISRRQQAHITYLRQVQPHYSMMKTITQNLHGIIREEENLRASMATTQGEEFCDSDWVIV